MTYVGIMQGRLSPPLGKRIQCFPRESWRDEFPRAAAAGLACIEWIYDTYGEDVNPLGSDRGIAELRSLQSQYGVTVRSLCADYFMERPLLRCPVEERQAVLSRLCWLLDRCGQLGLGSIVLPFVDNSSIVSEDDEEIVLACLQAAIPTAERLGMAMLLETSLPPVQFRRLLTRAQHPLVGVNYDIGNSASLGYTAAEELSAYGQRIGSVHIKDRVRNGMTVPLGTGDADVVEVFAGLDRLDYHSGFILQVARSAAGEEVEWAEQNRRWVLERWKKSSHGPAMRGRDR